MTKPVHLSRSVGVLPALLLACTGGKDTGQIRVDTALVYVEASGPSHFFPQVGDSNRNLHDGSVLPDPAAQACGSASLPDTQSWPRTTNTLFTKGITLSIRLPPTFVPVSTPGRWEDKRATPVDFTSSLTVLLGSMRGYPSPSLGGDVQQVQIHECKFPNPRGTTEVASFVVKWSGPADLPTHYVVARVPLTPDTAMLVEAEAYDSLTQAEFVSALHTLVLSHR